MLAARVLSSHVRHQVGVAGSSQLFACVAARITAELSLAEQSEEEGSKGLVGNRCSRFVASVPRETLEVADLKAFLVSRYCLTRMC
jgi:hypothetical protein